MRATPHHPHPRALLLLLPARTHRGGLPPRLMAPSGLKSCPTILTIFSPEGYTKQRHHFTPSRTTGVGGRGAQEDVGATGEGSLVAPHTLMGELPPLSPTPHPGARSRAQACQVHTRCRQ